MTTSELTQLNKIASNQKPWLITAELKKYLASVVPEDPATAPTSPVEPLRTQSQHNSLFLWFQMIEHEAGNAGITWNQLVGKTHQLKITKEGLHVMAKQLSEALWGIKSTKE